MSLQIELSQHQKKIDWYTLRRKLDQSDVRKDFWTVTENREKENGQFLAGVSPVTIPKTIAGHIWAQVPFSFLRRRMDILSNHEDDGFEDVTNTVKTRSFKLNRDRNLLTTNVPIDKL